ncbi:MAG: DUF4198 domain-containing protein [Planctomycetota bacterium]
MLRKAGWVSCLLVLTAMSAEAQSLWLEPDPIAPAAGHPVTVHLRLGDYFAGEEQKLIKDKVTTFQRLRKNGRENLSLVDGATPAASYDAGEDGVEILALTWKGQVAGYYCKSIQVVGEAKPGHPLRYSELGQRLEIVPQTDPVLLARDGGRLEVQVLYEREPLAGIRVIAMPRDEPVDGMQRAVTDEIGVTSLDLDRAGSWLIQVSYKGSETRSRATLILEAGRP